MTLNEAVERQKEPLLQTLCESIRIRSVQQPAQEGAPYGPGVQQCLEHALAAARALGFATVDLDHQMGWCEYGTGDEMIAVLGHLDVVPEGNGWSFDPFGGIVQEGKVFGRGSMDDKGPTMAALYALAALRDSGLPLRRRIRLLFGTNEETGSADMKYYKAHGGEMPVMGFTPDGEYPVINGEKGIITVDYTTRYTQSGPVQLASITGGTAHNIVPAAARAEIVCPAEQRAELMQLAAGERISCTETDRGFTLQAAGVSAHGATPEIGINAIGLLAMALDKLPLSAEAAARIHFIAETIGLDTTGAKLGIALQDEASGALSFNLGTIEGDAEGFTVRINYRYPVTFTYDDCAPACTRAFAEAGFAMGNESHKACLYMPEDCALVKTLLGVYAQETGLPAKAKSIGGGTYAKAIPNVVAFGPIFPGDEVREHKPDEFIEVDKLMKNMHIYAQALYQLAK
ncbi:MAG: dipeptidase PepV [Subdoligranulum sp.]|nr:dipeptidase PepV [Subdoligranulum sp.]